MTSFSLPPGVAASGNTIATDAQRRAAVENVGGRPTPEDIATAPSSTADHVLQAAADANPLMQVARGIAAARIAKEAGEECGPAHHRAVREGTVAVTEADMQAAADTAETRHAADLAKSTGKSHLEVVVGPSPDGQS